MLRFTWTPDRAGSDADCFDHSLYLPDSISAMIQRDPTSIQQRRDELRARLQAEIPSEEERAEVEWELLMVEREIARLDDA